METRNMRNEELEMVSMELYRYMCNVLVGTETIVSYRRLFFKLFDDTFNKGLNIEMISSGSKSEGLDLPGSDFDVMLLNKTFKVFEGTDTIHYIGCALTLETNDAHPGFALLKLPESVATLFPEFLTKTDNGYFLSSCKWKDFYKTELSSIHGPSSYTGSRDLDMVYCLQCNTWPIAAKHWLLRNRSSGWPSQELMEKITKLGVLVVPVGSKSSSNEVNELEWRMSFSLSEKVLIHSFNHVQLICYALLKIFLKEIVNSNERLSKLLCSYYMKTLLFWILEETDGSKWTPENLIHCFLVCVKRLCYWISINYIPNYFIPSHNMIDGRLSTEVRNELIRMLNRVLSDRGWVIIFYANSLNGFCDKVTVSFNQTIGYTVFDKAIFPLYTTLMMPYPYRMLIYIIHRIISCSVSKSVKSIYALQFLCLNEFSLSTIKYCDGDPQSRRAKRSHNKCTYLRYKQILSRLLINTYSDAASGWLLLAAFFYNHQEYYKMFPLLDLVTAVLSIDRFCLSIFEKVNFVHTINRKRLTANCSFLKRLRQEVMKDVPYIYDTKKSFLDHKNLAFTEIGIFLPCYPSIMLNYFSFLAHHELGNISKAEFKLRTLQHTVYRTVYRSPHSCVSAYHYLFKALIVFKDLVGLYMATTIFHKIMRQSQEYKTFLEDMSSFNDETAPLARMTQELYG